MFAAQRAVGIDGAVVGPEAFVLRYFSGEHGDRVLLVNLGVDLRLDPAAEPLLAPPEDRRWGLLWSSEDPAYGGTGPFPGSCHRPRAPDRSRTGRAGATPA